MNVEIRIDELVVTLPAALAAGGEIAIRRALEGELSRALSADPVSAFRQAVRVHERVAGDITLPAGTVSPHVLGRALASSVRREIAT